MQEFLSVELMEILLKKRAFISFSDPYVPHFPKMRKYSFDLASINLNFEVLQQADCVLIATNHDDFDYGMIAEHAKLIVDTRGVYKD